MTPRPELSNSRIEIATDANAVSCLARPKPVSALVAMVIFAACLAVIPLYFLIDAVSLITKDRDAFGAVTASIGSSIMVVPAVIVMLVMIRRSRRRCGVEIVASTVTLHTPDSTLSKHVFDLKELKGATLVGRGKTATLTIERRKGFNIQVFISYPSASLGPAMDSINKMVIHDRVHGFEVIPVAQVVAIEPPMLGEGI